MNKIVEILMSRDGMAEDEAKALVRDARARVVEGEDPEEILYEDFGLEPDYIMELL